MWAGWYPARRLAEAAETLFWSRFGQGHGPAPHIFESTTCSHLWRRAMALRGVFPQPVNGLAEILCPEPLDTDRRYLSQDVGPAPLPASPLPSRLSDRPASARTSSMP